MGLANREDTNGPYQAVLVLTPRGWAYLAALALTCSWPNHQLWDRRNSPVSSSVLAPCFGQLAPLPTESQHGRFISSEDDRPVAECWPRRQLSSPPGFKQRSTPNIGTSYQGRLIGPSSTLQQLKTLIQTKFKISCKAHALHARSSSTGVAMPANMPSAQVYCCSC